MEHRLTVILAADVVEFGDLMEIYEERTHAALRASHAKMSGLLAMHQGRIFAFAGDSYLAEFDEMVGQRRRKTPRC